MEIDQRWLPEAAEIRQGTVRLARRLRSERVGEGLSLNKLSVLGHLLRHGPMSPGSWPPPTTSSRSR